MKITIEKAREYSKELWTWLTEHPDCEKHEWPGWERPDIKAYGSPFSYEWCFACLYHTLSTDWHCRRECIIPVFSKVGGCTKNKSPYEAWRRSDCYIERSKLAEEIANGCGV